MCTPVVLPYIIGTMVVSQVAGTVMSMQAAQAQATAMGRAAEQNANAAEAAAVDAAARGEGEAALVRQRGTMVRASQRVAEASNNVDVQSETALQLAEATAWNTERDAQTVKANAAREAFGYRAQGINFLNDAAVGQATAANQQTAGLIGMAGGIASTIGTGLSMGGYFSQKAQTPGLSKG